MAKNKKVIHYRDTCIGCGSCELVCPKYWKMNEEDGKADLINSEQKGDTFQTKLDIEDEEDMKLAASLCPVNIIKVS
jgi:ferredoxin